MLQKQDSLSFIFNIRIKSNMSLREIIRSSLNIPFLLIIRFRTELIVELLENKQRSPHNSPTYLSNLILIIYMKRWISTISFERVFQSADSWELFIDFNEICKICVSKENDFVHSKRQDTLWHRRHSGFILGAYGFYEEKKNLSTSCNTQCHCTISNILKNAFTFNRQVITQDIVLRLPFIGQYQ